MPKIVKETRSEYDHIFRSLRAAMLCVMLARHPVVGQPKRFRPDHLRIKVQDLVPGLYTEKIFDEVLARAIVSGDVVVEKQRTVLERPLVGEHLTFFTSVEWKGANDND